MSASARSRTPGWRWPVSCWAAASPVQNSVAAGSSATSSPQPPVSAALAAAASVPASSAARHWPRTSAAVSLAKMPAPHPPTPRTLLRAGGRAAGAERGDDAERGERGGAEEGGAVRRGADERRVERHADRAAEQVVRRLEDARRHALLVAADVGHGLVRRDDERDRKRDAEHDERRAEVDCVARGLGRAREPQERGGAEGERHDEQAARRAARDRAAGGERDDGGDAVERQDREGRLDRA